MRLGYLVLILGTLGLASCKKDEAPASEAPKSQATPAAAEKAPEPATSAAPEQPGPAAASPAPAPTVGSTKEESKADEKTEKAKDTLSQEPTTLAEAEKLLDTAALDLDKLVGAKGAKGGKLDKGAGPGASALAAGDSRCPEACKAMTSLRRAAAAVCRLAGDSNARCSRAKDIVKDSESRVTVCKCEG